MRLCRYPPTAHCPSHVARSYSVHLNAKDNPPLAYSGVTAHSPLTHSEETPSVTFSLQALLQAKTIKANRVQMFEPVLPTLQCLTHLYPYPKDILMTGKSTAINYHGQHLDSALINALV